MSKTLLKVRGEIHDLEIENLKPGSEKCGMCSPSKIIHLRKKPIQSTPGTKIGEHSVANENIIYLHLNGVEIRNKEKLSRTPLEESKN